MKRTKCFLLDDDQMFCQGLLLQAAHFGIDLDVFYSPLEFERLEFFDYASGIVDIDLGAVKGTELKNYLAAIFGNCPIIYISGKDRIEPGNDVPPLRHFASKALGFRNILHAAVKAIEYDQEWGNKPIQAHFSPLLDVSFEKRGLILIDDDPPYRDLMKAYARALGIPLDGFSSLVDLGSFARIREYDVAIVDYHLQGMKGNEITEYFSVFFRNSPFVMVSAEEDSAKIRGSWPKSVKAFIPKIVGPHAILSEAVRIYRETHRQQVDAVGDSIRRSSWELGDCRTAQNDGVFSQA